MPEFQTVGFATKSTKGREECRLCVLQIRFSGGRSGASTVFSTIRSDIQSGGEQRFRFETCRIPLWNKRVFAAQTRRPWRRIATKITKIASVFHRVSRFRQSPQLRKVEKYFTNIVKPCAVSLLCIFVFFVAIIQLKTECTFTSSRNSAWSEKRVRSSQVSSERSLRKPTGLTHWRVHMPVYRRVFTCVALNTVLLLTELSQRQQD